MFKYTLVVLLTSLFVNVYPNIAWNEQAPPPTHTPGAIQTLPPTHLEKGPYWVISEIIPSTTATIRGEEVTFDIRLTNQTGTHYKHVEVSLTPSIPGQKGWFECEPFHASNVSPQQGFRARVTITPTSRAPMGTHTFYTSINMPGYPPFIIKRGPKLRVIQAKEGTPLKSIVPKEVLITVRAKKEVLKPLLEKLERSYRLEVVEITELGSLKRSLIRLRIPDGRTVDEVIDSLSRDPYKITPQPNYIYRSCGVDKADPLLDLQYALKTMGADRLPSGIDGSGVKVALIDTGVDYLHQDLKGRIAQKKDVTDNDTFQDDLHGTALAGIIAAHCGNGVGICGLAPGAEIIAIKACRPITEGKMAAMTTSYWLAQGLDFAILQKAQVINLSLGGPKDPIVIELINEAFSRGSVIVAAAGDKGLTTYPPYPAALPEVIAVAAVDIKENPYAEGIKGDFVTLCAPGVDIMTTLPGDKYNFCTGTSMAAAYVTGAVVLLLQKYSNLKPQKVRSLLERSTKDLGASGKNDECGCGLLDLEILLDKEKGK
jgi:hypothetical protein